MRQRFIDQVAIVTGGSRGIGFAISKALTQEGAKVVIAALNPENGHNAAEGIAEVGGEVEFIPVDVTQSEQVEYLVARTISQYGAIHTLINNAGVHDSAAFWDESEELWNRMYRVNVLGTVFPSQLVVRQFIDQGSGTIVNVASKAGVVGEPGHAAYSASKGAVISLTRAMAVELAPHSIRVNAVCPGPVLTDMLLEAVPTEAGRKRLANDAPLGRVGRPEDIAEAVLFLASAESDWCTGQTISIDGGLSILK
jgi:NAD(P)-dependent dehydrogenase (short-subunit alcohol dehydrogenase family)